MNYLTHILLIITFVGHCQQDINTNKFTLIKEYHDNGILKSTGYSHKGNKIGSWIYWYENGNKEKEGFYRLNEIIETQNRNKINYDSLIINPVYKDIFIQEKGDTLDGALIFVLSDLWAYAWYPDGKVKSESISDSINMITNYIEYYQNGQKSFSLKYKEGKLSGKCEYWYESGKLMAISNFTNDKLNGEYQIWYEDGNKQRVEYYKRGVQGGIWKYYSKKGKLIKEETYEEGKLINTQEYK